MPDNLSLHPHPLLHPKMEMGAKETVAPPIGEIRTKEIEIKLETIERIISKMAWKMEVVMS